MIFFKLSAGDIKMRFSCLAALLSLFLAGCSTPAQVSPLEQLALQIQHEPGAAIVIGTISKNDGSGLLARYPSNAFLGFESNVFVMDPDAGKPTPLRFHVGHYTRAAAQRYVLKDFIDAAGRTYSLDGMKYGRPILLDLYPGEIVYIGDIQFKIDTYGQLRITVEDHWKDYVQAHPLSPALQARVVKRLLTMPPILPVAHTGLQAPPR